MFGFVMADVEELEPQEKKRYQQVYCGICRSIRERASGTARLALQYDMTFLALLLMSLYEPEEASGKPACGFHPLSPRPYLSNPCIDYAADMNVLLAYYKALDDWQDDKSLKGRAGALLFRKPAEKIAARYPRQSQAVQACLQKLSNLEKAACPEPDGPAGAFGELMGELMVYREDLWANALRQLGQALGRFIYLADAAVDYRSDRRHHRYNPFLAMGTGEDWSRWEEYLVLTMGRCAQYYESLPLVQDKKLLDNILYSGVWIAYRGKQKEENKER